MDFIEEIFDLIFSLVPLLIFIIITRGIVRASKRNGSGSSKSAPSNKPVQYTPAKAKTPAKTQPVKVNEKASPAAKVLAEDRKNDWLAKQLREEARIARRNRMDLGAVHDEDCDADKLKREHRRDHKKLNQQF